MDYFVCHHCPSFPSSLLDRHPLSGAYPRVSNTSSYRLACLHAFLLAAAAYRDDQRCRAKYGKYWEQYCKEVPYKIVPGLL